MKYLFALMLGVALLSSCGNDKNAISDTAKKYVAENYAGATIVQNYPGVPGDPVQFYKGTTQKMDIINTLTKSMLDSQDKSLLKKNLKESEIKAIEAANGDEGFYIVSLAIKQPDSSLQRVKIVVSKDGKVLN